jgi:hypothetical protein
MTMGASLVLNANDCQSGTGRSESQSCDSNGSCRTLALDLRDSSVFNRFHVIF